MRQSVILIYALIALAGGPAVAAELDFGRYRALVIGINAYKHLPRLDTPVNDASAVHDVLRRDYGYESTLLLNPDRTQLVEALDELRAELTPDDNLLIYYAGHGFLDRPTGEGFWLTVNAKPDSQVEWVPVSTVTRLLKASQAKHALVVADSCYSGVLVRDAPAVLRVGADRLVELRRMSQKRARKAMTSGGLEPVIDGGGDGHSVFTRAFLDALRENDQVLDGYQLFHELRRRVVVNADQTPQYSDIRLAGDEGGDYLFVPKGRASSAGTGPAVGANPGPSGINEPGAATMELAFWQSIQASQNAGDYQAYLSRYPDGAFSPLARNRMASLQPPGPAPAPRVTEPAVRPRPTEPAAIPAPVEPAPKPRVVVPPPEPSKVELRPIEASFVTLRNANVRSAPDTDAAVVATLPAETEVYVPARTPDGQWFKIDLGTGGSGYVFSPLLQDKLAWDSLQRERQRANEARARQQTVAAATTVPRAPQAPPAVVAPPRAPDPVVTPPAPPAPRGPDGKWSLRIKAVSFEDGKHGEVEEIVTVEDGRLRKELKDYHMDVDARLNFRNEQVEGELLLDIGRPWRPFWVKVKGDVASGAFSQTYSALARDFRASNYRTLDVEFSLKRN
jgi:uncharacterized caspase-like protein